MFDRYACGNEPTSSEEMLKLGVNSVDCQDYLFKKRAQQLITMIQSAKYPVVMLTKEDLQKYSYEEGRENQISNKRIFNKPSNKS